MRSILTMTSWILLSVGVAAAQPWATLDGPSAEIRYFRFFYQFIGDPNTTPAVLKQHRDMVISRFRLTTPAHSQAIDLASQEYASAFRSFRAAVANVVATSGPKTDAQRQRLQDLGVGLDGSLVEITARLKQRLGPEAAARITQPVYQKPPFVLKRP